MKFLIFALFLIFLSTTVFAGPPQFKATPSATPLADCEGCGALADAGAKLKAVGHKDFQAHAIAQEAVAKAISRLRRRLDGTWSDSQLQVIVTALAGESDHESRQFIMQPNATYFEDSREDLGKKIKTMLTPLQAKSILFDVDVVIHTAKSGNNSPDPELLKIRKELQDQEK